ncbi:MAG: hypothetical protein JWO08_1687 [Verrucomicrobiaceae bacterium]|nr:hypothetical protein [Verrucomicrobiaceae bacterium]
MNPRRGEAEANIFGESIFEKKQEEAHLEYLSFREAAENEYCYICGKPWATFSSAGEPCLHWLLRPKGVKTKHIEQLMLAQGYFRPASFVRFIANFAKPYKNINDLEDEGDPAAVFHWTCCWKHIRWTFKCGLNDLRGHAGSQTDFPHFHMEMRLDGRAFVDFGSLHIPLSKVDLANLQINSDPASPMKVVFGPYGSGMQDAMEMDPDYIIDNIQTKPGQTEDDAVYHLDSIFSGDGDKGIPGELIDKAIADAKISGKTIAHHLYAAGVKGRTIIGAAKSVPEKADRSTTNRHKRKG